MTGLAGTGAMLRLSLRMDRVRLPVWVGAITLVVVGTAASFQGLYPDAASRQVFAAGIASNPALRALYGPLHAPESIGGLTVWRQGVIQLVLVSLMNLLTVVRHTRAAEESGQLELVGAAAIERRAPLAAAVLTAALADLAIGVAVAAGMAASGEALAGSIAFGAALATTGLAFAGIAAVTAQVPESSRPASGMAGAVLAASFVLRAAGDTADGVSWLSWASPLGWAERVRPYADEAWWVLGLLLGLAVAGVVVADRLLARRDLGGGLVPPRPGPPTAAASLSGPGGLAWRLHRTTVLWWTLGMAIGGGVFGGIVDALTTLFDDTPQLAAILERIGGTGRVIDVFLGAILGVFAILASAYAVTAVLRLRAEEVALRAEQVLATSTSRWRWAASHLVLAAGVPALLLAVGGATAGLASGIVTDRGVGETWRVAAAALVHLPAVWVVVGLTVLVLGLLPARTSLAYGALAAFLLLGQVGEALQLPQPLLDLSPFAHVPALPGATLTWEPLAWLLAVAVTTGGLGLVGLRRRDLAP